jgi:hypothetical protein
LVWRKTWVLIKDPTPRVASKIKIKMQSRVAEPLPLMIEFLIFGQFKDI